MNTVDMVVENHSQLICENYNFLVLPIPIPHFFFFSKRKVTGCPVYSSTPLGIFLKIY